MWGLRSPTPRGRTESCTLRILSDALTGAHGEGGAACHCGLEKRNKVLRSFMVKDHLYDVSVPSAYSGDIRPSTKCWEKNLRSKVFHCAELRDGTRP